MVVDPLTSSAIDALQKNFADLFKRGEFAAAAELFADDAMLLPPGSEIVAGRSNIQSYWGRGGAVQEMLFEPGDRKAIGEGAVRETGGLKLWSKGPGQQVREISCKYALVWHKLGEGWKLESLIWNRIADAAGAARQPRRGGQGRLQAGVGGGGQGRFQPGVGGGQGVGGGGQGRFQGGGGQGAGGGQGRFQGGGGQGVNGGGQGRFQGGGGQGAGGGGQGRFQGGGVGGGQGGRFRGGQGGGQGQGGGPRGQGQGGGQGGPRGQGGGQGPGGRGGGAAKSPEPFVPRVD